LAKNGYSSFLITKIYSTGTDLRFPKK